MTNNSVKYLVFCFFFHVCVCVFLYSVFHPLPPPSIFPRSTAASCCYAGLRDPELRSVSIFSLLSRPVPQRRGTTTYIIITWATCLYLSPSICFKTPFERVLIEVTRIGRQNKKRMAFLSPGVMSRASPHGGAVELRPLVNTPHPFPLLFFFSSTRLPSCSSSPCRPRSSSSVAAARARACVCVCVCVFFFSSSGASLPDKRAIYHQSWPPEYTFNSRFPPFVRLKGEDLFVCLFWGDNNISPPPHWFLDFLLELRHFSGGRYHSCQYSKMQPPPRKVSDFRYVVFFSSFCPDNDR